MKQSIREKHVTLIEEYQLLGSQLKQTTRESLAEKFDINVHALTGALRLTLDDFKLLKNVLDDRKKMLIRRKELRAYLHP